jgi:Uma2 family endonuclease
MAVQSPIASQARRFTADEVWRMVDVGIIGEDERLELIDGELCLVTPAGWDHGWIVTELGRRLGQIYGLDGHAVQMQTTVGGSMYYLPEPDVAVRPARGPWTREKRHPRVDEFLLVVEVSVTTARTDQRKVHLYAEAGAPVYWLVDVPRRSVITHCGSRSDGTWESVVEVPMGGELTVPGPGAILAVAEIFPESSGG